MRTNRFLLLSLLATLASFPAQAGSVSDIDADGIPDAFDNCSAFSNGPLSPPGTIGAACQQFDADDDGFGNACDGDYDQDNVHGGSDFGYILSVFGSGNALADLDCDGVVAGSDFTRYLTIFGLAPGPGAI